MMQRNRQVAGTILFLAALVVTTCTFPGQRAPATPMAPPATRVPTPAPTWTPLPADAAAQAGPGLNILPAPQMETWAEKRARADTLSGEGQRLYDQGDTDGAIARWEEAIALYEEIGYGIEAGGLCNQIADIELRRGNHAAAYASYMKAIQVTLSALEPLIQESLPVDQEALKQADALYQRGLDQAAQQDYAGARETLLQARKLYQEMDYPAGELRVLVAIADCYMHEENYFQGLATILEALTLVQGMPVGTPLEEQYLAGLEAFQQGRLQEAIETWEAAWPRLLETGDKGTAGAAVANLGNAYAMLGEYDRALAYYAQAMAIFTELADEAEVATVLTNEGIALVQQGAFAEGRQRLERALAMWQEQGNRAAEANTLNALGLSYLEEGNVAQSPPYFEQARQIFYEINDREGEGDAVNNLGFYHYRRGEYQQALELFQQSLSMRQEAGLRAKETESLCNIGSALMGLGRYDEAEASFRQALQMQETFGNPFFTIPSLNNLASLQVERGRYQEGLAGYLRVLDLAQGQGNRRIQAQVETNIAGTYYYLGMLDEALQYAQKALDIFTEMGDLAGQANVQQNLSAIYLRLEDYPRALDAAHAAQEAWTAVGNTVGQAAISLNLALIYQGQGDLPAAVASGEAALELLPAAEHPGERAKGLIFTGLLYLEQGRSEEAAALLEEALRIGRDLPNEPLQLAALAGLGGVRQAEGDNEGALALYQEAIDLLEGLQGAITVDDLKTSFLGSMADLYELTVLLLHEMGRDEEAFYYAERSRARVLLDAMAGRPWAVHSRIPPELAGREETLRACIYDTTRRLQVEANREAGGELSRQREECQRQYQELLREIALQDGTLGLFLGTPPATAQEVQRDCLDKETTLVEYYVATDKTVVFVLTSQGLVAQDIPLGRERLALEVAAFRKLLEQGWGAEAEEASRSLYGLLVGPIEPYLQGTYLGVVPHDTLHYLPFQALRKDDRFLAEEHVVFYAPSASVLRLLRTGGGELPAAERLLALGDPDGTLPNARESVGRIAGLYGVQPFLGAEAREALVKERGPGANVLHLASHSTLDPWNPLFSSLHLAAGGEEDGELEVYEIMGLDLEGPAVVVLSACSTALGERSRGDEVMALNRAFMQAGVPGVVSTLWAVDDAATGALMLTFHQQLRAGLGPAEALREAQLAAIRQGAMPRDWAGFVYVGPAEGRWGQARRKPWPLLAGLGAAAILVGAGLYVGLRQRRKRAVRRAGAVGE